MPMTAHQRHMAAVKAAATKRLKAQQLRNAAAGVTTPPPPPPPRATPPPPPPWNAPPPPPPPPTSPRPAAQPANGGGLWGRRQPTVDDARAEVLVALENLYALQCQASGITDTMRNAFEQYKKALTRAMTPSTDILLRNEAEAALQVAAIRLVKLTF